MNSWMVIYLAIAGVVFLEIWNMLFVIAVPICILKSINCIIHILNPIFLLYKPKKYPPLSNLVPTSLRPDRYEIAHCAILIRPSGMRPRRLHNTQSMQRIGIWFRGRRLNKIPIGVVGYFFPRRTEKRFVHFGTETPRRATLGERLAGRELETDEAAGVVEELGHAFGPWGACFEGEGAEELTSSELVYKR